MKNKRYINYVSPRKMRIDTICFEIYYDGRRKIRYKEKRKMAFKTEMQRLQKEKVQKC